MTPLLLIFIWLFLIVGKTPVFFSLCISSSLYLFLNESTLLIIPQRLVAASNSFPLLAAPFFIFTGNVMNASGITDRIFKFADVLVGHIPGGLGHANIMGSLIFSGMSGAAVADAGGLGAIEIKAMRERGYDAEFSAGITAASSTIGPIIPPSVPLVFYGVLGGVSIGGLFVAGIIPGMLIAGALMVMVYWYSQKKGFQTPERPTVKTFCIAVKEALLSLFTPVLLIGGIVSGVFTPTEAAFVASAYALFLGMVVYRKIGVQDLFKIVIDTVETTAIVMLLVMSASLFGWILTRAQAPQQLAEFVLSHISNKFLLLLLINVLLLFVGCFMESLAAMIIMLPVLLPVVIGLEVNLIQFGIVMVFNLMIGTLTPPVGIVIYVVSRVSGIPFEKVMRGTLPFLVPLIIVLLLITYFPALTLYLPGILLGVE